LTDSVSCPFPETRVSLLTLTMSSVGWSVMMLITPAMASLP